MISIIDSDYDEDDEYQQCEMDEIFSLSPQDGQSNEEDDDGDFEHIRLDHESMSKRHEYPGGDGQSEFESDDEDLSIAAGGGLFSNHLSKQKLFSSKSRMDPVFSNTLSSNQHQHLIELYNQCQKMNCEDCKRSLIHHNHLCSMHKQVTNRLAN